MTESDDLRRELSDVIGRHEQRMRQRGLPVAPATERALQRVRPIIDALEVLLSDAATNTAPRTPAFQALIDAWNAYVDGGGQPGSTLPRLTSIIPLTDDVPL